jgi:NDP-sugar pyrophosphorylase family protein
MKPTLVILAAGMASRYGSMKQIQSFGPAGETIMDYSIYDAIRAGFGKVVFIIRKDFEQDFKAIFEPKLRGKIATDYVFQSIHAFINGYTIPNERTKPWGTAHAVLCAKDAVKEPFCVINADDFYGRDAFEKAYQFLTTDCTDENYCIVGYELARTLSAHGTVSRGVCDVDTDNNLVEINERTKIYRNDEGNIIYEDGIKDVVVPEDSKVSMNFWGFAPNIFDFTEKLFSDFVSKNLNDPKAEFFIPLVADHFIKTGGHIKVVPTDAQWFGVTYKEDAPSVQASIDALVQAGAYPNNLWNL